MDSFQCEALMRYLSICSGVEAVSLAWKPLGFIPVAFSEIDPFCCALLAQRFPEVPNLGDVTEIQGEEIIERFERPDILVGGTPCQSFSVAGKRLGVTDPRGNITLHYLRLVAQIRPTWVVWENVPGVFSIDGGKTFQQIISTLDELGYGVAWRVLDAQYFGVPQRRRRVFVVGHLGDWRGAAAALFDGERGAGHLTPGQEPWPQNTRANTDRPAPDRFAGTLEADLCRRSSGSYFKSLIAEQAFVFESRIARNNRDGSERVCPPLKAQSGTTGRGDSAPMVAFTQAAVSEQWQARISYPVSSKWHKRAGGPSGDEVQNAVASSGPDGMWHVRRFTPLECERLQGMPDNWTLVEWRRRPASNTQRYKAIGNSMAVPVVRWIGERIARWKQ